VASSLGVDDALLRKLVDVEDVRHTQKDSNQRGNAKTNRGERKISAKIGPGGSTAGPPGSTAAAVVPLHWR
jgi:hypothetical protein